MTAPDDATARPAPDDATAVSAPAVRRFPPMRVPSAAAVLAAVVAVFVIVLLLVIAESIFIFALGLIIAFLLDPLVTWLAGHRMPRGLATMLVMGGTAILLFVLASVFLDTVAEQAASLVAALPDSFDQITAWISSTNLNPSIQADLIKWVDSVAAQLEAFNFTSILGPLVGILGSLIGSFFTLIALPFFLFYVLAGRPALSRSINEALPVQWMTDVQVVIRLLLDSGGTYVRAEAIVAAILGTLTWVALMAFGVVIDPAFADVALFLALIAAFSELIPNFGPWIAAIPAVLFALTVSPFAAVATILLYIVLMFIEGQVLVPKIEGGAFSFHPAVVLFIVVAGIGLLGLLGAIIALPVSAWAWRSVKYAFRRASGMPAGMATALGTPPGETAGAPGAAAGAALGAAAGAAPGAAAEPAA